MANSDKSKNKNNLENDDSKNKKKKSPPSKVKRFFKYFFLTILILGLLVSVVGVGYVVAVLKTAPALDIESIHNLNQTSMLYDNKEQFIDNLPTEEERYVIRYDQMPQNLINAYIAIEDERFMTHKGIDVKRIVGAALRDVKYILTGEGSVHGASTITQQLIKNTLLFEEASNENKADSGPLASVNRKIKEIYLALQLDKSLSKEEIITAYLNTIPLGGYVYGVEAAAHYYFGKSAIDLTLPECAYIAGITQAPTTYSAYNTEEEDYPNTYIERTETVLDKMLELGFITQDEYSSAYNFTAENQFTFKPVINDYKVNYEWFVYPALEQVRADLKEKYKYTDEEVNKLFVNGGLKIYTTLDTEMQDAVQAVLDDRNNLNVDWDTNPSDEMTYDDNNGNGVQDTDEISYPLLQAAATVMDYRTGHVLALVGGRGNQPPHAINRAYDDLKPIASTTKPLTVYGPGIDTKIITAATPLDDAPVSSAILNKYGFRTLNNYNFKFDGFITARDGIAFSKNVTSVKLVDKMGLDTALEYGEKAGIVYNNVSKTSMSAIALGQHDNNPNDRDGGNTTILASAFGSFGNNGVRTEPILYTKVIDSTGKVLLDKEAKTTQLFSPQTAYIMYDILKGPLTRFDAGAAQFGSIPVSGKTGTTDNVDHFWFAGLTPYYSGSVWIGKDKGGAMSGYSSAAAELWGKVMAPVHEGLEYKEIERPSGIVNATVCIDSGKLATDLCKKDQRGDGVRVRNEMFIDGTQPNSFCDVHVKVKVNKENNKLATDDTPKDLIEEKVFIKKENASKEAADYKYVVPTEKDDTKPEEKIKLSQIGLKEGMDLYDAIVILNERTIKYTFKGQSISGSLKPKEYTLVSFTPEIKKDGTVELTIKKYDKHEEEAPGIGAPPTATPENPQNPDSNNNN